MLSYVLLFGAATSSRLNIIQIVADDLGYNDLGHANGNKSMTPHIDGLIREGVELKDYYTFKVCAPTRTSLMTGRYPWKTGYYDMIDDGNHCVDPRFVMLPEILKRANYSTHAIGKWDVGSISKVCTPTKRGFDSFLGYYVACLEDYWYHFSPDCHNDSIGFLPVDLSFNHAANHSFAGLEGVNGTYHAHIFASRAVNIIDAHSNRQGTPQPLFLYLAPQNVHLGCGSGIAGTGRPKGIQAPCDSVDRFGLTKGDTFKAQSANLLELDYVVGNVTAALHRNGMWENTVIVFVSDNGGPLDHTTNAPLRGGKHTFWEGGLRVVGFVSGGAMPPSRRGTQYHGMLHSSDWLPTFATGIAGLQLAKGSTGPTTLDGKDAWRAILDGSASPRTEVVHQVRNQFFNSSSTGYALRVGDYKLIVGNAGDARVIAWPEPGTHPTPFGSDGGVRESGTNHCRAPPSKGEHGKQACRPTCLFNVVDDISESHDLCPKGVCANSTHQSIQASLLKRLAEAGATGPSTDLAYRFNKTAYQSASALVCKNAKSSNFIEPADV